MSSAVKPACKAPVHCWPGRLLPPSCTKPDAARTPRTRSFLPPAAPADAGFAGVLQASTSVKHLVLPSHWSQRNQMLPDLVRCYGACGRTIIFTETKKDANELTNVLSETCGARALHGDIPQVGSAPGTHAACREPRDAPSRRFACLCP